MLQIGREVLRRPAVQLVPDVALVHQHGDRLGLPRPARSRGDDLQVAESRRDQVEMARMAVVEQDAAAARQARRRGRSCRRRSAPESSLRCTARRTASRPDRSPGRCPSPRRRSRGSRAPRRCSGAARARPRRRCADRCGASGRGSRRDARARSRSRSRAPRIASASGMNLVKPKSRIVRTPLRAEVLGHLVLGRVRRLRVPGLLLLRELLRRCAAGSRAACPSANGCRSSSCLSVSRSEIRSLDARVAQQLGGGPSKAMRPFSST